jgi:uncharacterized protein (TIGR02996 family)
MSPDLTSLLCALRDQPDDEIAYLALADWCLDQPEAPTQARSEHVRLSLPLCKLPRFSPEARELTRRLRALEKKHQATWLGSMHQFGHRCDFQPGGLIQFEVTGGRVQQWRAAKAGPPAEQDFAWVSSFVIRAVTFADLDWLAHSIPVGYLRSFTLGVPENLGVALMGVLSRCRWLPGVRALNLNSYSYPNLADVGAAGLADLPCLESLQELQLSNADLGVDGCVSIAHSPHLCRLILQRCGLASGQLRALLVPTFAPPLAVLSLEGNALTPAAIDVLANWPALAN